MLQQLDPCTSWFVCSASQAWWRGRLPWQCTVRCAPARTRRVPLLRRLYPSQQNSRQSSQWQLRRTLPCLRGDTARAFCERERSACACAEFTDLAAGSQVHPSQRFITLVYHGKERDRATSCSSLCVYSVVITSYTMLANECGIVSTIKGKNEFIDLASDDEEDGPGMLPHARAARVSLSERRHRSTVHSAWSPRRAACYLASWLQRQVRS